jgi:hypothetical protein
MATVRHQLTPRAPGASAMTATRPVLLAIVLLASAAPLDRSDAGTRTGAADLRMSAWPAPTGHRQPRVIDIPLDAHGWPFAFDIVDRPLDRRLLICRGC